jgi:hypothetical protein
MIVIIQFPEYLNQYVFHRLITPDTPKPTCIATSAGDALSYFLMITFRRPRNGEIMPELHDGLRIRVSTKLKLEKKIFLSADAQNAFRKLAHKFFKDDFRSYMNMLSSNDAFIKSSILTFMESHGIAFNERVYEMLYKDYQRQRKKNK